MFNNSTNNYTDPPPSFNPPPSYIPPPSYLPQENTTSFSNPDPNVNTNSSTNTGAPVNIYEQMMIQQQELYRQQQEYRQKMLEENYPVKFVIGHAIIVGAICVTLIVLQIVMIVNQYPMYYIGQGIWVAAYFIIPLSLELILSK